MQGKESGHCWWMNHDNQHCNAPADYQLCGFYFCFHHKDQAIEMGAAHWTKLYRAFWN